MHCAAAAFVIGLLPLFGLGLVSDQRTDWVYVIVSAVLGISSCFLLTLPNTKEPDLGAVRDRSGIDLLRADEP